MLVYDLVVLVHLLGMAALVGGWMVQLPARGDRWVSPGILVGAIVQVVSGLVLVGLAEGVAGLGRDGDTVTVGAKLAVGLLVAGLVWVNRRRHLLPGGVYLLIGALAVGNVAVAVLG